MAKGKKKTTKKTVKLDKDIIASMAAEFRDKLLNLVKEGIEEEAMKHFLFVILSFSFHYESV